MPGRALYASRTIRATYCTRAAMGAIARLMPPRVASRRQPRRPGGLRKLFLIRTASQAPSRPARARRTLLPTSTPRRQPKRADRAPRTRQRSGVEGSAQPQRTRPAAGLRKHNVRRAASHARRQPTAGLRKPSMMRHPRVPRGLLPALRPCKAPAATAESNRFSRGRRQELDSRRSCIIASAVITFSRLQHSLPRG